MKLQFYCTYSNPKSLNIAIYHQEISEHFALGYDSYTHFTSPIRRYPDLIIHRAIKTLIQKSPKGFINIKNTNNNTNRTNNTNNTNNK